MRHTRCFRLMAALFGVWFTFTLIQPNGMMGMTMNGSGASMDMSSNDKSSNDLSSAQTMATATPAINGMHASNVASADMDMSADQMAAMHSSPSESAAEQGTPAQSNAPVECDQHDCCCSALSPISLMPVATLSWLPDHVVNQETPDNGDCVVHTDGQVMLPFANGPPRTVTA